MTRQVNSQSVARFRNNRVLVSGAKFYFDGRPLILKSIKTLRCVYFMLRNNASGPSGPGMPISGPEALLRNRKYVFSCEAQGMRICVE